MTAPTSERTCLVNDAFPKISSDKDILGGVPVFAGTRVPIETVLASLDAGLSFERVHASYQFLTPELVEAARVYSAANPRKGAPRRFADANPDFILKNSKVVRR